MTGATELDEAIQTGTPGVVRSTAGLGVTALLRPDHLSVLLAPRLGARRDEVLRAIGRGDDALDNLVDAVPVAPEPFATTMEIWHCSKTPKPAFSKATKFLRRWADAECGLVRVGATSGAQHYRYDHAVDHDA